MKFSRGHVTKGAMIGLITGMLYSRFYPVDTDSYSRLEELKKDHEVAEYIRVSNNTAEKRNRLEGSIIIAGTLAGAAVGLAYGIRKKPRERY